MLVRYSLTSKLLRVGNLLVSMNNSGILVNVTFLRRLRLAASLFLIALSGLSVQAQIGHLNGAVSGTVADTSGAHILGANIRLTGTNGLVRSTPSDAEGSFSLLDLPSGSYRMDASATGFAPYSNPNISVAVGRNLQLSITMHLAGTKESVTVSAQANSIDTSQTSSVANIDKDRIEELP